MSLINYFVHTGKMRFKNPHKLPSVDVNKTRRATAIY